MISMPKRRVPISNAVGGACSARLSAICPSAVLAPVRPICARAEPLTTELPMNTRSSLSSSQASPSALLCAGARFSTGYGSPVSCAWFTKKSCASISRASAAIRSPAESIRMSPGTSCATGSSTGTPSRSTVVVTATCAASAAAVCSARYSCTKSSVTLISTMAPMISEPVRSPVSAETPAATISTSTSGLRKRSSSCSQIGRVSAGCRRFAPNCSSRLAASTPLSPGCRGLGVNMETEGAMPPCRSSYSFDSKKSCAPAQSPAQRRLRRPGARSGAHAPAGSPSGPPGCAGCAV